MIRILVSVLCLAGAGALFMLYTKPAYDSTKVYQEQIMQYDLALDKAAELQQLKQSLLSRYNSFNPSDIERLNKLLPDHVDNVRLVLDLDTLASKHGLALQNVVIAAPTAGTGLEEQEIIGPEGERHEALTLQFATNGTYDRFVQLLTDLEKSLRVVDVMALNMNIAGESNGQPIYRFDITLRTYWLK